MFGTGDGRSRTYPQLCMLAATGREARVRKQQQKILSDRGDVLVEFADEVNAKAGRGSSKLVPVKVSGKVVLALRSQRALKLVHGGRSRYRLSVPDMLDVAFGKRHNRNASADAHGVSARTIQRVMCVTAHTVLEGQLLLLRNFRDFLVEKPECRPDFAAAALMWDEKSQTLAVDAIPGAKLHQQRSTWTVLVGRLHFAVGFLGSGNSGGLKNFKVYREVVFPPVPLASNSASAIASLFRHPLAQPLMDVVLDILQKSKRRSFVHEADGHLANEKFHFWRYAKMRQLVAGTATAATDAPEPILISWIC